MIELNVIHYKMLKTRFFSLKKNEKERRKNMFFIFMALWFILNTRFTLEAFLVGLPICLAMTWFCAKFMGYDYKKDVKRLKLIPKGLHYFWTLIVEIVKANLSVIHMILSDTEVVQPQVVIFRTELKNESSQVVLANSITLTPGTITMDITEEDGLAILEFEARFFLWNMIRRIVSAIEWVSKGKASLDDVRAALDGKDMSFGMARPDALTLIDVEYDWLDFQPAEPSMFSDRLKEESFRDGLRRNFFGSL